MEILAAYQNLTPSQLLVGGALSDSVIAKLDHWVSPGQTTPTAPILLIQGTDDESVPAFLTEMLAVELQEDYSQPVTFQELQGETHDSAVVKSANTVATWLVSRFFLYDASPARTPQSPLPTRRPVRRPGVASHHARPKTSRERRAAALRCRWSRGEPRGGGSGGEP